MSYSTAFRHMIRWKVITSLVLNLAIPLTLDVQFSNMYLNYYRSNGSYVFACFLDLSKAFDSVNHKTMFKQLIDLKFPANLVKLLAFWYVSQQMNVRWKNIITDCFRVKNGPRQGSVLSPYLFCVYMRYLTNSIIKSGIGCHITGRPVNILLYADDVVLLAPS